MGAGHKRLGSIGHAARQEDVAQDIHFRLWRKRDKRQHAGTAENQRVRLGAAAGISSDGVCDAAIHTSIRTGHDNAVLRHCQARNHMVGIGNARVQDAHQRRVCAANANLGRERGGADNRAANGCKGSRHIRRDLAVGAIAAGPRARLHRLIAAGKHLHGDGNRVGPIGRQVILRAIRLTVEICQISRRIGEFKLVKAPDQVGSRSAGWRHRCRSKHEIGRENKLRCRIDGRTGTGIANLDREHHVRTGQRLQFRIQVGCQHPGL